MQCVPCCSSPPQLQMVVIQVDAVCGAAQAATAAEMCWTWVFAVCCAALAWQSYGACCGCSGCPRRCSQTAGPWRRAFLLQLRSVTLVQLQQCHADILGWAALMDPGCRLCMAVLCRRTSSASQPSQQRHATLLAGALVPQPVTTGSGTRQQCHATHWQLASPHALAAGCLSLLSDV